MLRGRGVFFQKQAKAYVNLPEQVEISKQSTFFSRSPARNWSRSKLQNELQNLLSRDHLSSFRGTGVQADDEILTIYIYFIEISAGLLSGDWLKEV